MKIEGLLMSSSQPNFWALDTKVVPSRIDDLPLEILSLIFIFVHQDLKTQKGAVFEGMIVLSTICKDWRQLALSIPELWSCIHIVENDQEGTHSTHPSAITMSLKLSKDVPLSLTLELYGSRIDTSNPNHTSNLTTVVFHLLSDNFHRWRSIACKTSFELPSIPEGSVAPYLEHIDIVSYSGNEIQEAEYIRALVAAAPNLRSYVDHGSIYGVPFPHMPWAQLHEYRFSNPIYAKQAFFLLDRAKSLVELCFVMHHSMNFFLEAGLSLSKTTSMIQSMVFSSAYPREIQELLVHLDTPNLESLNLHFPTNRFTRGVVENLLQHCSIRIFPFLSSASDSFRLSRLGLHNLIVDESEFIDCLRILSPSLTDLSIRTDEVISPLEMVTNNVLKSLTCNVSTQTDSEPLCPTLKNLTFERSVGADDGVLGDMVQSRLSSQTSEKRPSNGTAVLAKLTMLRRLDVVFTLHTHPVDEKRLNEFYEKGLNGAVQFASIQVG